MYPDILVLRHGETEWNRAGRMQGQLDSKLTDTGVKQALRQRVALKELDLSDWAVLSSPQIRALHTASLVFAGTNKLVATDPALQEIDVGSWAGLQREDIKERVQSRGVILSGPLDHYDHTPGESFEDLHRRCANLLDRLMGPTVLVTHGITSRMLRVIATGADISDLATVPGGQGVVHGVIAGHPQTFGLEDTQSHGTL